MIRETLPSTKVIILSMYGTKEHVFRALKAGAWGYLLKRCAASELTEAVKAVCRNQPYLTKSIADVIVRDYIDLGSSTPASDPVDVLSRRERQVLQLVAEGCDNRTIASKLNLSYKTVHTYRSRILQKLDLHSTAELIRFAMQHTLTAEE